VEIVGSAVGARRGRRFSVTTGGMAAAAAAAAAAGLQDGKGE
jgi:cobalamin biosynthesis protein CbiD